MPRATIYRASSSLLRCMMAVSASGLGVCVSVVSGARVLVKGKLLRVPDSCTLLELLRTVSEGRDQVNTLDDTRVTVQCAKNDGGSWIEAELSSDVGLLAGEFGCRYIRFVVPVEEPARKRARTVSDVLMGEAQARDRLPKPKHVTNKKAELFNAVRDLLETRKIGFHSSSAHTEGFDVVNTLTNILWNIDANHDSLLQATVKKGATKVPKLPKVWLQFSGYNDYKAKKVAKPRLSGDCVQRSAQQLFDLAGRASLASLASQAWQHTRLEIEGLANTLSGYATWLNEANTAQQERQSRTCPPRQVAEDTVIEHRSSRSADSARVDSTCGALESVIDSAGLFSPVCLGEQVFYRKMNSMQRHRFLEKLQLPYPIDILKYSPGGKLGNVVIVWKAPEDRTDSQLMTDAVRMTLALKPQLPEYHTRQQRLDFSTSYGNLTKISPAVRRALYLDLTGDSSASPNPDMDARTRLLVLGESPELINDLRRLSTGRVPSFEVFFDQMGEVIEEWVAADERRHGIAHMSQYLSVPDLCEEVKCRCPPDTPIPSLDLVRLQFCPKNPASHAALNFTGRYQIKYKIQVRQLRAHHPDEHYAAALFKYFRELAIRFRDVCTLVFADDKSKIDVGEPGLALSTGVRGRRSLAPVNSVISALDHDVKSKASLTPSVTMICDIPEEITSSFYRGSVHVTLKDAVFQQSTPFRHATELSQLLLRRDVPPILLLYTDGGPDHRLTYPSVKCALICLFLHLDLDFLVAARTAPGQSWANPVERVMSILNLAIQNVAICRVANDELTEEKLRSCNSMADIRKAATSDLGLKKKWGESLQPIMELLCSRFERLSLKGQPVHTEEWAEEPEIDTFSRHIHTVDASVDRNHLRQKDIDKNPDLKEFLATHTRSRHYSFQIRKCGAPSCQLCKPPRLSQEQWQDCKWLPDPEPNPIDPSRYLSFKDLYGKDTSEKYRPNMKKAAEVCDPKKSSSSQFTGQRVRDLVMCGECLKPRCVFAQYILSEIQKLALNSVKETMDYVCGSDLFPSGHELHILVYVRTSIECNSPIETSYYSCGRLPLVCYYCGGLNAERDAELLKRFRSVMPMCSHCKQEALPPVAKMPIHQK